MVCDFVFDLEAGEVQWRSVGPTPAFLPHSTPSLLADETFVRDLEQLRTRIGQPILAKSRSCDAQIAELERVARRIGARLTETLLSAEARTAVCKRLGEADRGVPRLTLRIVGGRNGDEALALPWELLMPETGCFCVEGARLDLVRDAMRSGAPELDTPTGPLSVAVAIAAPEDQNALRYEEEAYRLLQVLAPLGQHAHFAELGEVDDLIEQILHTRPTVVHFSGHGLPGELVFEDEFGMSNRISVETMMSRLQPLRAPDPTRHALPRLFVLAACYGASAPRGEHEVDAGARLSTAAALHREGFSGVLGYFGPIGDGVSTSAEAGLYEALSTGETLLSAVRRARAALARVHEHAGEQYVCPLGWAGLAVFLRGPDCPLTSCPQPTGTGVRSAARLGRETIEVSGLPVLVHGFIGRRARQHEIRRRYRAGQRLFVLQGLGGLGKTALASQLLCKVFTDRAQDRLILRLREDTDIDELRRQAEVHGEVHALPDWRGRVEELRRRHPDPAEGFGETVLALRRDCPGMVIYADNMEALQTGPTDEAPVPGGIGAWRPGVERWWAIMESFAEGGVVLASTRYAWADMPSGALISLDRMSRADLWRMLETFPTLARLPWAVRPAIAAAVDGRPRTLELLEGYLRHADEDPARDIEGAWAEAVAPVLAKHGAELSADLLLARLWRHLSPAARDQAVAAVVLGQPAPVRVLDALGPATAELRRAGLLTCHRDRTRLSAGSWEERWSMHASVRQFALARIHGVDLRSVRTAAAAEYVAMIAEDGAQVADYFEALRLHLANKDGASAWPLAQSLVRWLRRWGQFMMAVDILEQVPEADLADDDRRELAALRVHMRAQAGISLAVEPEALDDAAESGSPAARVVRLAEMAGVRVLQADHAGAERLLRQALDIHEHELSRGHIDYGGTLYMYGVVAQSQGNYQEAERRVREALSVCGAVRGNEHPDYGNMLFELAQVLSQQGKLAEAEQTLRAALAVQERASGRQHPGYGTHLAALASILAQQGQYASAEPLLHEALSVIEEALGREHPDRAGVLHELVNVLTLQGKYVEAERPLRKSLYIHEKTRGPDHPAYGASLHQLACLMAAQGRYREAEQPIRDSLTLKARTIGRDHPDYGASLHELGRILAGLERYTEAEQTIRESLAISEATHGRGHPGYASSLHELAAALSGQGRHAEAERALREGLAILEKTVGRNHPDVGASLHQLALVLSRQKRSAEAEQYLHEALAVRARAFGPDHPELCPTLTNLALTMIEQGRPHDAVVPLERAARIGRDHLGEAHETTRRICNYLELALRLSSLSSPSSSTRPPTGASSGATASLAPPSDSTAPRLGPAQAAPPPETRGSSPRGTSGFDGASARELVTDYTDPNGVQGYVVQAYDRASATYTMIDALLTDVKWIMTKTPLVPGMGIPMFTFLTIRLMHQFEIAGGELRRLVVRGNHNVESVLQLALLERNGARLDEAVRDTRAYLSVTTPMIQSSHVVSDVRVHGGKRDTLAALLDWHVHGGSPRRRAIARDRRAEHAALLASSGLSTQDVVLFDYEVQVQLLPLEPRR